MVPTATLPSAGAAVGSAALGASAPTEGGRGRDHVVVAARLQLVMRPSSLGGGRILRRTLSVRLSVRPVIVAIGNIFSSTASVTDVLFGTH